jgi:hypothetical protein
MEAANPKTMNRLIWLVIAAMLGTLYVSYRWAGLSLDVTHRWPVLLLIPACLCLSFYYRYYRIDPYISAGTEFSAQLLIILLTGTLLSFAAATADFPYRDDILFHLDQELGFDWRAYLDFFNTHYIVGRTIHFIYFTIHVQPVLIGIALLWTRRFVRLQQFVLTVAIALCLTIAIFILTPAVANYAHLGLQRADFGNLAPSCAFEHIRHLESLRRGTTHVVKLDDLEGLIIFPSFHAVAAVLFCWAIWPVRRLRWFFGPINLLMLVATPVDGAHYAVDLLGGAAVAGFAIALTTYMTRVVCARSIAQPVILNEAQGLPSSRPA